MQNLCARSKNASEYEPHDRKAAQCTLEEERQGVFGSVWLCLSQFEGMGREGVFGSVWVCLGQFGCV